MRTARLALLPLCILLVLIGTGVAVASVRAGDGADGRPEVTAGPDGVWTADPAELDAATLNPQGDRFGDGRPDLAQAPDGAWWAAWSLADRGERDIAVSRYDGTSWSPFELVVSGNDRDDFDPRIGFLGNGTPVVVWWQKGTPEDRSPRVVTSYGTLSGWSPVTVLSGEPAWRPGIVLDGDLLTVAWETAQGISIERFRFGTDSHGMPSDPAPFPGRDRQPPTDEEREMPNDPEDPE